MEFKIDTKEKFHVISIRETNLAANMTEELDKCLLPFLQNDVKNLVLNLEGVKSLEPAAGIRLADLQNRFYEQQASFVICNLGPAVEKTLDEIGLLELINAVPTESEAWDMVQMEEIERDLLGGE